MKTLFFVLFLAACEEEAPPPPPIKPRKLESVQTRQEAASQQIEAYEYTSVGKRDPFRAYFLDQVIEEEDKDAQRALTELERFELDQLKLVAVLGGISEPRAMFEDPSGKGWSVTLGTAIGRHGGKVSKIKKDEVVILEEFRDPATNRKVASPVTIRLPADELELKQ